MAFNNFKAFYCDSVKYAAITAWATGTAKNVGDLVRQVSPSLNNERVFICAIAGTTHATTEPSWDTGRGGSTTDNTVTWIECTGHSAVCNDAANTPNWTSGSKAQSVSRGHIIKNDAGTHFFLARNSGTGHSTTEPTWNTTTGNTTTENGSITWVCIGSVSAFSNFQGAAARVQAAFANWGNFGGIEPYLLYIGSDHAETQSSTSINWSSRGTQGAPIDIFCCDVAGTLPPTSSDLRTTATVTVTASNSMNLNSTFRVLYGVNFFCGTSGNVTLNLNGDILNDKNYENCTFNLPSGTGSGAGFQFSRSGGRTTVRNCSFRFSNAGQQLFTGGYVKFENCAFADTGTVPTTLIGNSVAGTVWEFNGCDLSPITGTIGANNSGSGSNVFIFNDCKMASSFTPWGFAGSNSQTGERVVYNRCSSGANPMQHLIIERAGTLTYTTTRVRNGGASQNSNPFAWKVDTTANASLGNEYFECPAIAAMNTTTGTKTVTVYGVVNGAALPTNADLHMDVTYLGSSSHTQGTIKSNRVADFLNTTSTTNHASDTSDWDDGLTARGNSTAYALGDTIKLASNPGRIFFCTTAGTSTGSEPGGYSSAVDGGSVTDGSAVFRAGVRFKLEVTLSSPDVQQAGLINASIRMGKLSTTYIIDPVLHIS